MAIPKFAKINLTLPVVVPIEYDGCGRIIHPVESFGKLLDECWMDLKSINLAERYQFNEELSRMYEEMGQKVAHHFTEEDARQLRMYKLAQERLKMQLQHSLAQAKLHRELYGISWEEFKALKIQESRLLQKMLKVTWNPKEQKYERDPAIKETDLPDIVAQWRKDSNQRYLDTFGVSMADWHKMNYVDQNKVAGQKGLRWDYATGWYIPLEKEQPK